jgi:hypothetical protein
MCWQGDRQKYVTGLFHVLTRGQAEICDWVTWINPVTYFCLSPWQHMDYPSHIFLTVPLSTHGLTQSHISACPLVNTWINPCADKGTGRNMWQGYSMCWQGDRQKYVTGLIHVLTRGQAEICDRVCLSRCQHMDYSSHIFLPVPLSAHILTLSHISACPLQG